MDVLSEIRIQPFGLKGLLGVPRDARGLVIFAHGSGSSRLSPRNNHVASALREAGLATLLLDLLTPDEERDRQNVFNIQLLASRLIEATRWAAADERTRGLAAAYFGASTGAAAALTAAVARDSPVEAVVSRGGRPDLALEILPQVSAPTLLLVGGLDRPVIEMNERALAALGGEKRIVIIDGASHLFEEPGTMEEVVRHAADWFLTHLRTTAAAYPAMEIEP